MSVAAGTRLGHYEIIELIGAGGMGEVYKALDPRLHRTVAVKILHEHISDSPEARARFEREAQTIARLNTPHICVVYDIGRQDRTDFLVMELLEGETLARRLERGPLPLDQTLRFAADIADGLDKAHRQGITHRDLKPSNIMLTKGGLKLLDFGLAKLQQSQIVSSLTAAPTKVEATAEGTILGSLHYMAPEQLEGSETDARTDIFAFGAVLHELLTGRKAFQGKSSVSVMSAILKDTPSPVSQLQPVSPPELDRLIARCLAKNPDDRWQSAGDLCYELKALYGSGIQSPGQKPVPKGSRSGGRRTISTFMAVLIAMTLAIASGFAAWMLKPSGPAGNARTSRMAIPLPPGDTLANLLIPAMALSPDGSMLVYAAARENGTAQLYLRAMDSMEVKPIDGTAGARGPFFSPNGKWIGFFTQSNLKKVPTSGGAPQTLCDVGGSNGGTWGDDDFIYYAPYSTSGIFKTRATDGKCEPLTKLDRTKGEVSHRAPQALPGGKALLFTVWTGPGTDEKHLHVYNLGADRHDELLRGANSGRYVPSGHILYSRAGALMAVPFDLASLKPNGSPVALAERAIDIEAASFTVSDSGTLAYLPASPRRNERRLVLVDSKNVTPLPLKTGAYFEPSLSPNGRFAAVTIDGPVEAIWLLEFQRFILTPLTSTALGSSQAPVWTNDGKRVAYRGTRNGFRNLFWKLVEGDANEERLTTSDDNQTPGSFSPLDKQLVFSDMDLTTGSDIWSLTLDGRKASEIRKHIFYEGSPVISPDGHWLAYTSSESGDRQIYVVPFPGPGGKNYQVSKDGGGEPVWSRKGNELFYRNGNKMMSVDVSTLPEKAGSPKVLFTGQYGTTDTGRADYDVDDEGRFLMVQSVEPELPATQIDVVLNWFQELKRIAPAN